MHETVNFNGKKTAKLVTVYKRHDRYSDRKGKEKVKSEILYTMFSVSY